MVHRQCQTKGVLTSDRRSLDNTSHGKHGGEDDSEERGEHSAGVGGSDGQEWSMTRVYEVGGRRRVGMGLPGKHPHFLYPSLRLTRA